MRQNMYDIIAVSIKLVHPDLFITMISNPNWKEIQTALLDGQKAEDRTYISYHVFHVKLRAIMEHILLDSPFGVTIARIRVEEFQKRGLPMQTSLYSSTILLKKL